MRIRMWPLDGQANDFIKLIQSKEATYKSHKWKTFFDLNFDVFHMHWPETYLNISNPFYRFGGTLLVIMYLLFLRLFCKEVVWTVHNLNPHENRSPKISWFCYLIFYKLSTQIIFLSNVSKTKFYNKYNLSTDVDRGRVIMHPLYPVPEVEDDGEIRPGFIFFGLMRAYKNIDGLLVEFGKIRFKPPLYCLGRCDLMFQEKLYKLPNEKVHFEFGAYEESRLQQYLNKSLGVIVPYTDITNSGVIFRALSANLNILLPDIEYVRELISDFGYENKCVFYSGSLTYKDLNNFISFAKRNEHSKKISCLEHNCLVRHEHLELYKLSQERKL